MKMNIEYRMNCTNKCTTDDTIGKTNSKGEIVRVFKEFLNDYRTGVNDYDEIHFRFVKE